jgi:hypothetical protein
MKTRKVKVRKQCHCQHCGGNILVGQEAYKRNEGSGGRNCREYYDIAWHVDKKQCVPHYKKDKCTNDCKNLTYK